MVNKGVVKKIEGNKIFVEVYKDAACSSCASCNDKTCGMREFKYTKGDLKVEDVVELSSSDKFILKLSFLIYIFPVLSLFLGYYIGSVKLGFSETKSILVSFFFLFLSMIFIFLVDKYKGEKFEEKIIIKKESN